jgi:hypothetical protein
MQKGGFDQACCFTVDSSGIPPSAATASVKPSKQTQILLEMSKRSDDDKSHWDQMLESVDLLFDRMNDINLAQQDLKN